MLGVVQFVMYCVFFVMMSTNTEKNSAVSEEEHVLGLWFLSGRKLGQYADQELLKSLFQNKTPDVSFKIILIHVHDQQGQH